MNPLLRFLSRAGGGGTVLPGVQHWYKVAEEGETVTVAGNVRFGTAQQWSAPQAVSGSVVATSANFGSTFDATKTKQLQCDSEVYATRHVKIMPLGDSITALDGINGYRVEMQFAFAPRTDLKPIDFVGNAVLAYNNNTDDNDHNGYSSYAAANLLVASGSGTGTGPFGSPPYYRDVRDIEDWFAGTAADIVILHLGTNDLAGPGTSTATVLAGYDLLLARARVQNPNVVFVVAQIIAIGTAFAGADARVIALNAAIPGWAAANTTVGSPIIVVDQHTGFDPVTMTSDGVHPNSTGAAQMSARFIAAIEPYITLPAALKHAYNVARFSYYQSSYPFINVTKNFGGYWGPDAPTPYASGGWPSVPAGLTVYCDVAFGMDPQFGYFPPGNYIVKTTNNLDVSITPGPGISAIVNANKQATFTISDVGAGNWGTFALRINYTNPSGSSVALTNQYCCLVSEEADLIAGEIFKQDYLALYANARVIRYLDWLGVNARWGDWVRFYADMANDETRASYTPELNGYPVPISICMKFAKKLNAEVMIAMPAGYAAVWFQMNVTTDRISHLGPDLTTVVPHGLSEGEPVLIAYTGGAPGSPLPAACAPLAKNVRYFTKNVTTNDYQLAATLGGTAINFTNGSNVSIGGTDFAIIGPVAPDQYNDLFVPFFNACAAVWPEAVMHVTWSNEFWNSTYKQTNISQFQASYQATGAVGSVGAGAGYNLLRVWKAAEQAFPTSQVNIIFENQAAFPSNPWATVWDYVDAAGFYGTAGQTIAQIMAARPTRAFYSFAPYAYLDFAFQDYNSAGVQPDFVYANNGNSFTIPDSYWDGLVAMGLSEAVHDTNLSVAYAQTKVPAIKFTTYEWGIAYATQFFFNTHTGGVLTIQSLKNYLDGAKGAAFYQDLFEDTILPNDIYCATQLLGPQGWRADDTSQVFDAFGIRDATPAHTSQRWNYFQSV